LDKCGIHAKIIDSGIVDQCYIHPFYTKLYSIIQINMRSPHRINYVSDVSNETANSFRNNSTKQIDITLNYLCIN